MSDVPRSLNDELRSLEHEREDYWDRFDRFLDLRLDWRAKTARALFHILPGDTILEIGAGTGRWTGALRRATRGECPVTAITFSDVASPDLLSSGAEVIAGGFSADRLRGRTFDYAVSWSLMTPESMADLLQSAKRFLKPGGEILFFGSNLWNPYRRLRRLLGYVLPFAALRRHGDAVDALSVVSLLSQIGFTQINVFPYDFLFPPLPRRFLFAARNLSLVLENAPGVRNLAGDLYVWARNPVGERTPRSTVSLAEHAVLRGAVSVVVPCRDEEMNVAPLVEGIIGHYGDYIHEVVIIDDGSRDRTAEVTRDLGRRDPRVRLVVRHPPHGVGWALRTGIQEARGKWILLMDCDFVQILPEIRDMFDRAANGDELIVGSRFSRESVLVNYPFPKIIANRSFHLLARLLLGRNLRDVTNNLKLARREVLQGQDWTSTGFEMNAETGLKPILAGHRPVEVPISWINRTLEMGRSHFRVVSVGPGYLRVLWEMVKKQWGW